MRGNNFRTFLERGHAMFDYNCRDHIVPLPPANPVEHQSIRRSTAAMYGTGKENWHFARVGIRGAFAAVFGGHSWGIRGHSRAFARLMPLCGCHRLHAKIMVSRLFCSQLPLPASHRTRHMKTQNSCRADLLYNTNRESQHWGRPGGQCMAARAS